LIGGIDFVADKKTREPFQAMNVLERAARKHGVILRFIGNRIALSPPLIITEAEIDEMFRRLRLAIQDTLTEQKLAA
jgi:4-aminobutyrate--pyruvate transaminase